MFAAGTHPTSPGNDAVATPSESATRERGAPQTRPKDSRRMRGTSHRAKRGADLSKVRQRQGSVASLLNDIFGELAECHPDLWDRRAYLMLVGLIYERLAVNEKEIPTDELAALAKILAENRRTQGRLGRRATLPTSAGAAASSDSRLPNNFADIVRQVYGTNFQAPRPNKQSS